MKFFRFNAGLAAILIAVALAFRPCRRPATRSATRRARRARRRRSGDRALLGDGRPRARVDPSGDRRRSASAPGSSRSSRRRSRIARTARCRSQALTVASFLSSAALLGGACTAMILGHWYLVIPSMQVSHLQSIVKLHIASMVVRVVVVGGGGVRGDRDLAAGLGPSFRHYIMSVGGIFFWQRVLFGLGRAGAAVVSHVGDREDSIDAVGDRNSLRRFLHRRRRRGAGEVPAARDARARVVQLNGLRIAPRSGTCAISACEPRQGRKAAALSRP